MKALLLCSTRIDPRRVPVSDFQLDHYGLDILDWLNEGWGGNSVEQVPGG